MSLAIIASILLLLNFYILYIASSRGVHLVAKQYERLLYIWSIKHITETFITCPVCRKILYLVLYANDP